MLLTVIVACGFYLCLFCITVENLGCLWWFPCFVLFCLWVGVCFRCCRYGFWCLLVLGTVWFVVDCLPIFVVFMVSGCLLDCWFWYFLVFCLFVDFERFVLMFKFVFIGFFCCLLPLTTACTFGFAKLWLCLFAELFVF